MRTRALAVVWMAWMIALAGLTPPFPAFAESPPPPPLLAASPWLSGSDWTLYFSYLPVSGIAEIRYRLGDRPWAVVDSGGRASLGEVPPGRHSIEIMALDAAGKELGRYKLRFDPDVESLLLARDILNQTVNAWVALGDREDWDETNLSFSHLVASKEALREIRYSLDNCALDRRFPLAPPKSSEASSPGKISGDEKLYEWIPKTVSFACVQLVYRDGEMSEPRRFHARRPGKTAPVGMQAAQAEPAKAGAGTAPTRPQPVTLKTSRSNSGWTLMFDFEAPEMLREVRYRFEGESEWYSTPPERKINVLLEKRYPSTSIMMEPERVAPGRHRIEVKRVDWSDVESGPFTLWFDPEKDILEDSKRLLAEYADEWAELSASDDQVLFNLGTLFHYTDVLREIRYSLNGCGLDQRFPFEPWTDLSEPPPIRGQTYLWLPLTVKSACVQLVFRDGEVTEPRQFFREEE